MIPVSSDQRESPPSGLPGAAPQNSSHRLRLSMLLCVTLSLALWAGRWGMAGLYAYPAQQLLEGWEAAEQAKRIESFDAERWQMAMNMLTQAQRLEPNSADLLYLVGRLHHHHALFQSPWSPQAKSQWRQTILAYQQALALRPTWGYLWVLLAQARLQSGEPHTLTRADWMRGIRFAPHSGDVQLTAIRIGFALWPQLDERQQALVDLLTKQAMPVYGETILQQAAKYKLLPRVQPLMSDNPQWQRLFDRLSKEK